jgi:hypothetical protein
MDERQTPPSSQVDEPLVASTTLVVTTTGQITLVLCHTPRLSNLTTIVVGAMRVRVVHTSVATLKRAVTTSLLPLVVVQIAARGERVPGGRTSAVRTVEERRCVWRRDPTIPAAREGITRRTTWIIAQTLAAAVGLVVVSVVEILGCHMHLPGAGMLPNMSW